MSKSDLLKDSMKGGLDGLLSSTKKSTGGKQPVPQEWLSFLALPPADLPFYPFVFLLYGNPFADGSARRDMLFPVQRYCLGGTFKYRYAI